MTPRYYNVEHLKSNLPHKGNVSSTLQYGKLSCKQQSEQSRKHRHNVQETVPKRSGLLHKANGGLFLRGLVS